MCAQEKSSCHSPIRGEKCSEPSGWPRRNEILSALNILAALEDLLRQGIDVLEALTGVGTHRHDRPAGPYRLQGLQELRAHLGLAVDVLIDQSVEQSVVIPAPEIYVLTVDLGEDIRLGEQGQGRYLQSKMSRRSEHERRYVSVRG